MILIRINCPDSKTAQTIAEAAVDARLAACANISAPIRSVYRWQGAIEHGDEIVLLLKTREALFDAVADLVTQHHPDETPAILALPVAQYSDAFGAWLDDQTT